MCSVTHCVGQNYILRRRNSILPCYYTYTYTLHRKYNRALKVEEEEKVEFYFLHSKEDDSSREHSYAFVATKKRPFFIFVSVQAEICIFPPRSSLLQHASSLTKFYVSNSRFPIYSLGTLSVLPFRSRVFDFEEKVKFNVRLLCPFHPLHKSTFLKHVEAARVIFRIL